jgi:hypothetical protein
MNALILIALNTFKDAIRQKVIFLMAFVAFALTLSSNYLLKFNLGQEQLAFIADFTTGALGFFGSVIAIVSVCQLFYSEFDNRTAMTLLSKPLGSFEFVAGKLLGAAMLLAVFVFAVSVLGYAMMAYTQYRLRELPPDILVGRHLELSASGFAAYAFLQFLKLLTVASLATFVCMVSRSLMFAIIVSFMACAVSLVLGSDFAEGGGIVEQVATFFFPNLRVFAASEAFIFEGANAAQLFAAAGYSLIYSFTLCALGVWAFSTRET